MISLLISITQLFVTVILFLFAYAYTLKTNIRSAIGEIPPIKTEKYIIAPVVSGVKWRPVLPNDNLQRLLLFILQIFGQRGGKRTVLNFIVYDRQKDMKVPVPPTEVVEALEKEKIDENLSDVSRQTAKKIFEEQIGSEFDLDLFIREPMKDRKTGIKIRLETTSPDKIQNITIAFLYICRDSIQGPR